MTLSVHHIYDQSSSLYVCLYLVLVRVSTKSSISQLFKNTYLPGTDVFIHEKNRPRIYVWGKASSLSLGTGNDFFVPTKKKPCPATVVCIGVRIGVGSLAVWHNYRGKESMDINEPHVVSSPVYHQERGQTQPHRTNYVRTRFKAGCTHELFRTCKVRVFATYGIFSSAAAAAQPDPQHRRLDGSCR